MAANHRITRHQHSNESWSIMDHWGYGSWGMDRIARWGMDRGMDRGVWIACGFWPLIHTLYFDLHPYMYHIISYYIVLYYYMLLLLLLLLYYYYYIMIIITILLLLLLLFIFILIIIINIIIILIRHIIGTCRMESSGFFGGFYEIVSIGD